MGGGGLGAGTGGGMATVPGAASGGLGAALSSAMPYMALAQGGMGLLNAAGEPARQATAISQQDEERRRAAAWQSPEYTQWAQQFWG